MKSFKFSAIEEVHICVALETYIDDLVSQRNSAISYSDSELRDSFIEYYNVLISEYTTLLTKIKNV